MCSPFNYLWYTVTFLPQHTVINISVHLKWFHTLGHQWKISSLSAFWGKMQTIQNLLPVTSSCVLPNFQHPDLCTVVDDISLKTSISSSTKVWLRTSKVYFHWSLEYFVKKNCQLYLPQHKKMTKKVFYIILVVSLAFLMVRL